MQSLASANAPSENRQAAAVSVAQLNDFTIMIVDDEPYNVLAVKRYLEQAGYTRFIMTSDSTAALEMVRARHPDLILLDIMMPGISGLEILQLLRREEETARIPVLILTSASDRATKSQALQLGATDFLPKPLDVTELLPRVRNALESKAYQDRLAATNRQLESANRRMTQGLRAAAKIQQSLLPNISPRIGPAVFSWRYQPCDELAGDFLNYFPLDDRYVAVYVVDVSGHGVASALLSVTLGRVLTPQVSSSSLLVQLVPGSQTPRIVPPAEVARELNNRFPMENQGELYFTMLYGVLDLELHTFRFVCAGHPELVHLRRGESPRLVKASDMAIGWAAGVDYTEHTLHLRPGDRLFLYSDGIPEAMDEGLNQLGNGRMLQVLSLGGSSSLDEGVNLLLEAVRQWCCPIGPRDDVSILGLQIA